MTDLADAPMPTVRFRQQPRPLTETLPRMDIAAFVGFATAGPIDVPVRVESVDEFTAVFGTEFSDGMARGQLHHTVRMFFANGGQRCWIVRVDRQWSAASFLVPSLLRARPYDADARMATMQSRSRGPWSGCHRLLAQVELQELGRTRLHPPMPHLMVEHSVELDRSADLAPGDLIVIEDETDEANGGTSSLGRTQILGFVRQIDDSSDRRMAMLAPTLVRSVAAPLHTGWARGQQLELIGPDSPEAVAVVAEVDEPAVERELIVTGPGKIVAGQLLRRRLAEQSDGPAQLARIDEVHRLGDDRFSLRLGPHVVQVEPWAGAAESSEVVDGTARRVDLLVRERRDGRRQRLSLGGPGAWPLDLHATARTPWSVVPTDDLLYDAVLREDQEQLRTVPRPGHRIAFAGSAAAVRSGQLVRWVEEGWPILWPEPPAVDLGMPPWEQAELVEGTDGAAGSEAVSVDQLFVDHRLCQTPLHRLPRVLEAYRLDPTVRLAGLHSLAHIEEIAVISCPDAGWQVVDADPAEEACPTPELTLRRAPTVDEDALVIGIGTEQDSKESIDRIELELGSRPDFVGASRRILAGDVEDLALVELQAEPDPCAPIRFVRARSSCRERWSSWSANLIVRDPFAACHEPTPPPSIEVELGASMLTVKVRTGAADPTVIVEISTEPDLANPTVFRAGLVDGKLAADHIGMWTDALPGWDLELTVDAAGFDRRPIYVRARIDRPNQLWSSTERVGVDAAVARPLGELVRPSQGNPEISAIHQAMIRLCAARRDALALLAFPLTWDAEQVGRHLGALRATPTVGELSAPGLARAERRALEYGAAFHPWLGVVPQPDEDRPREVAWATPDGWVAGVMARLALDEGPWRAPARRPLLEVAAVMRLDGPQGRIRATGLNQIARNPDDPVLLTADTLLQWGAAGGTRRPLLTDLNVRMLLIFIRRLALLVGRATVFEPNDHELRAHVHLRLDEALRGLFLRGALAGRTAAEAYRVSLPTRLNGRPEAERGRLYVEIDVAPSRPLEFLTVDLVLGGPIGAGRP